MSEDAHENLRYAQALLGHQVPAGDISQVIERALAVFVRQLEKTKFAATTRPRAGRVSSRSETRHIPAPVRRAVWERDGGQCTFVSESGHRCDACTDLEFDHVQAFARGGEATVDGIRLLCRAHNQYQAERTFGGEFMRHKRIAAAEARAEAKAQAAVAHAEAARAEQAVAAERTASEAAVLEVVPCLRRLGYSAREARAAAALCREMAEASLEERVRVALTYVRLRGTKVIRAGALEPALAAAS